MKEIFIDYKDQNQRLDKFLIKYLNKAPKSFIYKMIRKKNIKYNGVKANGNEMILYGDSIQIYFSEETINNFRQDINMIYYKREFDIIYEDENVLICNKPIGLLAQPDDNINQNTLVDQIVCYLYESGQYNPEKSNGFKPAICNRLDRNTSGIIIAGKNLKALQCINKAIHDGKVDKFYKTIVKGIITKSDILIDYYIKDTNSNKARIIDEYNEKTKKIITEYKPLKIGKKYTLLEIKLITGKTHQIRAHLKSINCPIIGDSKYGEFKTNILFKERYNLKSQFLHSYKLILREDIGELSYLNGKVFEARPPEIFKAIEDDLF